MVTKNIVVDENLPIFFETLKLCQANEAILEYLNIKYTYGFEINDPEIINRLKSC